MVDFKFESPGANLALIIHAWRRVYCEEFPFQGGSSVWTGECAAQAVRIWRGSDFLIAKTSRRLR